MLRTVNEMQFSVRIRIENGPNWDKLRPDGPQLARMQTLPTCINRKQSFTDCQTVPIEKLFYHPQLTWGPLLGSVLYQEVL